MEFPGIENLSQLAVWAPRALSVYALKTKAFPGNNTAFLINQKAFKAWEWLEEKFSDEPDEQMILMDIKIGQDHAIGDLEGILLARMRQDEQYKEFIEMLRELGILFSESPDIDAKQMIQYFDLDTSLPLSENDYSFLIKDDPKPEGIIIEDIQTSGIKRNIEVHAQENDVARVEEGEKQAYLYELFYGTNRLAIMNDTGDTVLRFSSKRGGQTTYGTCSVSIPKSHRFGAIGGPWWRRWLFWDDDRLKLIGHDEIESDPFWRKIKDSSNSETHAMVYIHGYNVDFQEAAIRAAQIGFDLNIDQMGFFSWPSQGSLDSYPADTASIQASENAIADFLVNFAKSVASDNVHVIAHSMGNRGFLRAIQRVLASAQERSDFRLGQVILAAPDVDADVFRDLASNIITCADQVTLYASPTDLAVHASEWIFEYPRAGFTPPVTITNNVDTVVVPSFNLLDLGHIYYAEAEAVLHDIFDLVMHNAPPERRQRLQRQQSSEGEYWKIRR